MARHGITVPEAEQAIKNDPVEIAYQLIDGEERYLVVGLTKAGRCLTIPYTERSKRARVITAWDSSKREEDVYWREKGV
jgi:uncharacterized DUF497 family protein